MRDFFISYNHRDHAWAKWIAWHLEKQGYQTYIQAWDFSPGSNFVVEMQKAAADSHCTIAVLSPNYLLSGFTAAEWAAAFAQDPTGEKRLLIPVRIAPCDLTGLLRSIVYIDLVGQSEIDALEMLLEGIGGVGRPQNPPVFPGEQPPAFPTDGSSITLDSKPVRPAAAEGDVIVVVNPTQNEIAEQFQKGEGVIVFRGLSGAGINRVLTPVFKTVLNKDTTTIYTDLETFSAEQRKDADSYFRALAYDVAANLDVSTDFNRTWKRNMTGQQNMVNFMRDGVLKNASGRVVWSVHHVDYLLDSEFRDDAFHFFRVLYNKRAMESTRGWDRLITILFCHGDPNTFIQGAGSSPFNIGVRFEFL